VEGWPEPGPWVGPDAVMRQWQQQRETWDADALEPISDFLDAADRVAVRFIWRGAGHGPESNMDFTVVYTVRKGSILVADPADPDRWYVSAASGPRTAHAATAATGRLYLWEHGAWRPLGLPGESMPYALPRSMGRYSLRWRTAASCTAATAVRPGSRRGFGSARSWLWPPPASDAARLFRRGDSLATHWQHPRRRTTSRSSTASPETPAERTTWKPQTQRTRS
jgi:hypothetical protein